MPTQSCANCQYLLVGKTEICNAFHSPSEDTKAINQCPDYLEKPESIIVSTFLELTKDKYIDPSSIQLVRQLVQSIPETDNIRYIDPSRIQLIRRIIQLITETDIRYIDPSRIQLIHQIIQLITEPDTNETLPRRYRSSIGVGQHIPRHITLVELQRVLYMLSGLEPDPKELPVGYEFHIMLSAYDEAVFVVEEIVLLSASSTRYVRVPCPGQIPEKDIPSINPATKVWRYSGNLGNPIML